MLVCYVIVRVQSFLGRDGISRQDPCLKGVVFSSERFEEVEDGSISHEAIIRTRHPAERHQAHSSIHVIGPWYLLYVRSGWDRYLCTYMLITVTHSHNIHKVTVS